MSPSSLTGNAGKYVPLQDTIRSFEAILGGETDSFPESAFSMVGNIDDVYNKAREIKV
jgi:F-type H+-transporting ATPase subunit beta